MDKRFEEIDKFLKEVAQEAEKMDKYGENEVYKKLEYYGLKEEDIIFVNDDIKYFSNNLSSEEIESEKRYIEKYASKKSDGWICHNHFETLCKRKDCPNNIIDSIIKYKFAIFNNKWNNELSQESSIKLYVPVGKKGVIELITSVLDEMLKENIKHSSKVSMNIRSDDFVIRVSEIEDAEKIANFIKEKNENDDLLVKPNPFVIRENNIGFASDRALSYNRNVAINIAQYIEELKEKGTLKDASLEGYTEFLQKKSLELFVDGKGLAELEKLEHDNRVRKPMEEWLANKKEIMDLMIMAVNPQCTMEQFTKHISDINNKEYHEEMIEYFSDLLKGVKREMPTKPSQHIEHNINENSKSKLAEAKARKMELQEEAKRIEEAEKVVEEIDNKGQSID